MIAAAVAVSLAAAPLTAEQVRIADHAGFVRVVVEARVRRRAGRIVIRLAGAPRRFKYAQVRELHGPERLVVDLWKAAPPARAVWTGRRGCLTSDGFVVRPRSVLTSGLERDLFEHSFIVRLRRADGTIHAQRPGTAVAGRWESRFRYPRIRGQTGTLEVVALSAKDGALDCLVQARVRLGG